MKSMMAMLALLLTSGCATVRIDGQEAHTIAAVDAGHSHPVADASAADDDSAYGEYAGYPRPDDE